MLEVCNSGTSASFFMLSFRFWDIISFHLVYGANATINWYDFIPCWRQNRNVADGNCSAAM